jgi:hypothetical protein
MKIHSDFRDYYDIGLSVGADPLLHYNRKQRWFCPSELKTKLPADTLSKVRYSPPDERRFGVERVLIGFCGTVYPCIRRLRGERDIENLYSPERLDVVFPFKAPSWGRMGEGWVRAYRKTQRERALFLANRFRLDALFLEIDAPIFVAQIARNRRFNEVEIVANAMLKPFEFAKAVDPFNAFQQVSMYLGNELVRRDEPDTIADEYRIAMHGYDKHSFRHPTRTSDLTSAS